MRTHEPGPRDPYAAPPDASLRLRAALERAREDAAAFARDPAAALAAVPGATGLSPRAAVAEAPRACAIGDPQAPVARFLDVLDRHALLSDAGRVADDAHLVSMGDHFDWGHADERAFAAECGFGILAWLAAHPPARVTILFGNHDLARVGELAPFDDASFAAARAEALALRATPMSTPGRAERRRAFLERHPSLPGVGVASRDLSTFEARQRRIVAALLDAGRMHAAVAVADDLLLVHAPVTSRDLPLLGLSDAALAHGAPAVRVADALSTIAQEAWEAWDGKSALDFGALYRPGSAQAGEARGVFVQRPADPAHGDRALFDGLPRRRFDPRELPRGLVQAIGHIRDNKCRELMAAWADDVAPADGPLRHLWTDGHSVRYRRGLPRAGEWAQEGAAHAALLVFTDGGMHHAQAADYELFDLKGRKALRERG